MDDEMAGQAVAPTQSSVPELEQVLVKIQELEQRIGDCELSLAQDAGIEGPENTDENVSNYGEKIKKLETVMREFKRFSKSLREADELTGVPEIEKDKENKTPEVAANAQVPKAITSQVGSPQKTGAPVAGEETGLDAGKKDNKAKETEAEKDAMEEVEKPSKDYPRDAVQKNALKQQPVKCAPKDPEEMESEEGKKVTANKYETLYRGIQEKMIQENSKRMAEKRAMAEKLSGRKTFVGMSSAKERTFTNGTNQTIKEYLHKSGIRL